MIDGFFTRIEKTKKRQRLTDTKGADYRRFSRRGCDGCPLFSDALCHPQMKPTGSKRASVYILGEAPGEFEDRDGEQFVGRSGKLLRNALKRAGLTSLRFDNCCRCRPPNNRTPDREELERCRAGVIRSVEATEPEVVVAVGGTALFWAVGESQILKWRGKLVPIRVGDHTCWLYPVIHPAFVVRAAGAKTYEAAGNDWKQIFHLDLQRLADMMSDDLPEPELELEETLDVGVQYALDNRSVRRFEKQLDLWIDDRAAVAYDVETAYLRPYSSLPPSHGLVSFSMSDGDTTWAVPLYHPEIHWSNTTELWLKELLLRFMRSRCLKIAHNASFDLEWLLVCAGYAGNEKYRRGLWADTMVQSYILDEQPGIHDLDQCCLRELGLPIKTFSNLSKADKKAMREVPLQKLLRYNAFDAKYTAKLYWAQYIKLERENLLDVYKMHIQRLWTAVRSQIKGLSVDYPTVAVFQKRIQRQIDRCIINIEDSAEARLFQKRTGKCLAPSSAPQLTTLFRDLLGRKEGLRKSNKTGYSVDDKALASMDLPIASSILELRHLRKLKSTYIDPCADPYDKAVKKARIVYVDGCLHTNIRLIGTVTGRLATRDPNVQNFPKRTDAWVRGLVTAPRGWTVEGKGFKQIMVSVDYGQVEPRVIAMSSKDRTLCEAIRNRYDIHQAWAEKIARYDDKAYRRYGKDIKKLRQDTKSNWVLAGFYGSSYDAISVRMGGLNRKCASLFEEFKEDFSGVWEWQERQLREYREKGYVSGLTGRRRHAPLTVNQVLNNPTQGAASDIVVDAMNRLSIRAVDEGEPAYQAVLNIHDDLTFYVPKKHSDEYIEQIVKDMLTPTFDWICVPLSVDVAVGPNWADLQYQGTYFSDEVGI